MTLTHGPPYSGAYASVSQASYMMVIGEASEKERWSGRNYDAQM
jgi:hypothetical protein